MKATTGTTSKDTLRKLFFVVVMVAVPAFGWAQSKTNSRPSAPAPHASAPAPHASAPAPHANAPAHSAAPNHSNASAPHSTAPGHTPSGHTTMGGTAGHSPNAANGHPGNNANARTSGTNRPDRPGAMNAGHTNAAAAGHNGNPGHVASNRTPPGRQVQLRNGGSASIRPNGQIRAINRNGMQIQHGVHGGRTIVSSHNGARVVTTGRHGGYVQRNYVSRNGRTYVSRTYVVNNVSYTSVYRSYGYGGYCCYYGYAPAYYYNPGYYGWAYNPWPAPAPYAWGWGGQPWYGYYGAYYQPYPVYPSAAFWLTDYVLAAGLRAAYEEQAAESGELLTPLGPDFPLVASMGSIPTADTSKVALSPEVKNLLADEVKAQLAADKDEAATKAKTSSAAGSGQATSNEPPPALDPKRKTFVVNDELSVVADGEECSLTAGDVISRVTDTPDADKNVDVKVLASKKDDCAVGKQVSVGVDDLQEMHNHFREQLTGGMDELSKKQGTGGLPKAPDTSKVDGEVPPPPADSSAAKVLKDQQSAADQTETEVKQEASSSGGGTQ